MQYRILSITGGGIRTLASLTFLLDLSTWMQANYHVRVEEYFNGFAGTSSGSIIATALAQGNSLDALNYMYYTPHSIHHMFMYPSHRWFHWPMYTHHVSDGRGKREVIQSMVPDVAMCDIVLPGHRLWIPTYNLSRREPVMWDSAVHSESIRDILDATMACPPYFPPVYIGTELHADGALCANCPDISGIFHGEQIMSIGTGTHDQAAFKPERYMRGLWGWIRNGLVDIAIRAPYQMHHSLLESTWGPARFFRMDNYLAPDVSANIFDFSPANVDAVRAMGHTWFNDTSRERLRAFFEYAPTSQLP